MKIHFTIAILLLVIGCQDVKYPEKPSNLIPKEKMIDILTEVYLSNAGRSYNLRIVRDSGYKLDSLMYKKYAIDSLQFAKSHAYYVNDLDNYAGMFDVVVLNLEKMKIGADSLKAQYEEHRRIKDSIKTDSLRAIEMEMDEDSIGQIRAISSPSPLKKVALDTLY